MAADSVMRADVAADLFPATKGRAAAAVPLYAAVTLASAAVIALQIAVMRIFAVGSWTHFGSLVVSLAMLGFGVSSVVLCLAERWFAAHWRTAAGCAVALFAPVAVGVDLVAQQIPFNAIFIISDPAQKWRLAANFALYMVPFLAGALFLGIVFVRAGEAFGRAYFADLAGAGAAGLAMFGVMYVVAPDDLILAPTALAGAAAACWFIGSRQWRGLAAALIVTAAAAIAHLALPGALGIQKLAVSDYKGVAYARRFPDSRRIFRALSPFGDLQVYASSYLHFAPGLSDNAAFNLPETPADAYVGLYLDGDGPTGIMRNLPVSQTAYFRFLPMSYPYLIQSRPDVFIARFGGGISTMVALRSHARGVTVAEPNPAVLRAFRDPALRQFTGDVLSDARVIPYDGRLFLERTSSRYDVVDLSLTDSTGLSNPGGFPVVEKYDYTEQAMETYMRALKPGGVLAVTVWNKEEPPKSILKLYAAIAQAAQAISNTPIDRSFFVAASYLSTTTVLYRNGGFTADELQKLASYTSDMSFDVIYAPGSRFDTAKAASAVGDYRRLIFGGAARGASTPGAAAPLIDEAAPAPGSGSDQSTEPLPSTLIDRLAWQDLVAGRWRNFADRYVFDSRPLTDDRPYFAGFVKLGDLVAALRQLDQLQDDWGYLAIWATLVVAFAAAVLLVLGPVLLRWRLAFSRQPGKLGAVIYFACLGLGYMMVEIALLARFMLPLGNPTVSAATVIAGMLVFSGLGSFAAERIRQRVHVALPLILAAVAALLFLYGVALDAPLRWIGAQPSAARVALSLALIAPPAFLMGFPMPGAMSLLAKQGKSSLFIWAWGVNGCCSVLGAAAAPILAVQMGLSFVLAASACGYLVAIPAFFLLFTDKSAWSRRKLIVAAALAILLVGRSAPASADQRVTFASAAGIGRPGAAIQGYLTRPGGHGPFPAVVLLHSCLGLPADRNAIGQTIASAGYVALFVDDFGTRGLTQTCLVDFPEGVADAYGALNYVAGLPFVDRTRIAAVGYSQGADTALTIASGRFASTFGSPQGATFKAAAAFYPPCANQAGARLALATLIVVGGRDSVTPAADCARLAEAQPRGISKLKLVVLAGADHAFDNPGFVGGARVYGMWLKYDGAAAEQAKAALLRFLAMELRQPGAR